MPLVFNMFNAKRCKRKRDEIERTTATGPGQLTAKKEQQSPSSSDGQTDSSANTSPHHGTQISMKEVIHESSMRILYVTIQWVKHIPTFKDLPFQDQSLILHQGWSEVFILSLLQWNLPVDIDAWLTSIGCQTSASGNSKYLMEIHDLQNIITKFRVAMPDSTELSCSKAIALFRPGEL